MFSSLHTNYIRPLFAMEPLDRRRLLSVDLGVEQEQAAVETGEDVAVENEEFITLTSLEVAGDGEEIVYEILEMSAPEDAPVIDGEEIPYSDDDLIFWSMGGVEGENVYDNPDEILEMTGGAGPEAEVEILVLAEGGESESTPEALTPGPSQSEMFAGSSPAGGLADDLFGSKNKSLIASSDAPLV